VAPVVDHLPEVFFKLQILCKYERGYVVILRKDQFLGKCKLKYLEVLLYATYF
jgi:hypothetical protein